MMPKAHRFSRSSYCASRRLYVAQRMRGGTGRAITDYFASKRTLRPSVIQSAFSPKVFRP